MVVERPLKPRARSRARRRPLWSNQERKIILRRLKRLSGYSPYLAALVLPGGLALVPLIAWWRKRASGRGPSDSRR
jgi:hypothetical protein